MGGHVSMETRVGRLECKTAVEPTLFEFGCWATEWLQRELGCDYWEAHSVLARLYQVVPAYEHLARPHADGSLEVAPVARAAAQDAGLDPKHAVEAVSRAVEDWHAWLRSFERRCDLRQVQLGGLVARPESGHESA